MRTKGIIKGIKICDALRDLLPFVQFKKREKHPWRSVYFSKVAGFFNLYKWYQIAQRTTYLVCHIAAELIHLKKIRSANIGSFAFNALKSDSHLSFSFICFNGSPLKMINNAFYFILKALLIFNIFKFCF